MVIFVMNYVTTWSWFAVMSCDLPALFANLAERERLHGHHSAEGQAIRLLSRALSGWSAGSLAPADVVALCDQAVTEWLQRRLKISPWSVLDLGHLLDRASAAGLVSADDVERLRRLVQLRSDSGQRDFPPAEVGSIIAASIHIVERHWS